jgi:hypothetical protein
MPQFDPELIQVMRSVLDDVMSSVPLEISGATAEGVTIFVSTHFMLPAYPSRAPSRSP